MDVIANRNAVIHVNLIEGEDYITLDSANGDKVTYTLLDSAGNVVGGVSDETYKFSGEISALDLQFDESCHIIGEGKDFDSRFVLITYTKNKKSTVIRQSYRVIPFLPYTISADDVYGLLGIGRDTVSETTIDIFGSYILLKQLIGDKFVEALSSGTDSAVKANRALLLKTALGLEKAIPLGVPKVETDNIVSETRYTMTMDDLLKLFDDIRDELKDLVSEIAEEDGQYDIAAFIIPYMTDPITGE